MNLKAMYFLSHLYDKEDELKQIAAAVFRSEWISEDQRR